MGLLSHEFTAGNIKLGPLETLTFTNRSHHTTQDLNVRLKQVWVIEKEKKPITFYMIYKAAAVFFLFKTSSFFKRALTAAHRGLSDRCGFPLVYLQYTDA